MIWYRDKRCHLFVDTGVFVVPKNVDISYFKPYIWTLVDWDESRKGVPGRLVSHGTMLFVIYTTPPNLERWHRLHSTTNLTTAIMDPWTGKEMLEA